MLETYLKAVQTADFVKRTGRISQFFGLVAESDGPKAFLGERCEIYSASSSVPVQAEVVGIKNGKVLLMPYGELRGISSGSEVIATGNSIDVPVGHALLGRVIDAFGRPLDGELPLNSDLRYPLYKEPINPLSRPPIKSILETGIRVIDALLTIGRGQRMGIFSGSGVGKSTLLGMIARNMDADINVIALVGERGREVRDFIENILGPDGLKKSVIVVATSDQPALVRAHAAWTATAIAEYFSDQANHVLLTMDSVTRFAMAQREIGLAIGEPPTARGYTPSVFALLPKLLERCGTNDSGGSITALYTVLVEGDDMNEPLADNVRAILDGGIVLSRELANQRHYPAIDVLHSISRLQPSLIDESELDESRSLVKILDVYERARDMVDIGAYQKGTRPDLDQVLNILPEINSFLQQLFTERSTREESVAELREVLRMHNQGSKS